MNVEKLVKDILKQHLQLGDSVDRFTPETALLGNLPELDSMGVVNIVAAIEQSVSCAIDDDEINADVFATLGSLMSFVESKL